MKLYEDILASLDRGKMWAGKWRITFWVKTPNRTLTIYYVFFEQNKMAEWGARNIATGVLMILVAFIVTLDQVGYIFSSVIVHTLLVHAIIV